jgi:hypothetical protein
VVSALPLSRTDDNKTAAGGVFSAVPKDNSPKPIENCRHFNHHSLALTPLQKFRLLSALPSDYHTKLAQDSTGDDENGANQNMYKEFENGPCRKFGSEKRLLDIEFSELDVKRLLDNHPLFREAVAKRVLKAQEIAMKESKWA